ncbi:MAG: hypothetical protein KKD35_07620, partial [Elusimicrobia bacterium]|nr:hypothetical protein [Elusimicrobiota bacterium]
MRAPEPHYFNRYFPGGILGQLPLNKSQAIIFILAMVAIFGAFPIFIMLSKHRAMINAQDGLSAVNWDTDEWVSPKIQVGTFRKKGKIAKNLDPIEVGVLLNFPLNKIASVMLINMERKGMIKINSLNPIIIEEKTAMSLENPYEGLILSGIKPGGVLDEKVIEQAVKTTMMGLEQKIWDADLEATKKYYESRIDKFEGTIQHNNETFYYENYRRGAKLLYEYSIDNDVEILVIRQFAEGNVGYHTNAKAAGFLVDKSLEL